MLRLASTAVAAAALVLPATALADDAGLLAAYRSQATTLRAQDAKIVKLTKRWTKHHTSGARIIKVLKAQRGTLFQVAAAVNGQTESSPNGATAKDLCLKATVANSNSDAAAIRAFVAFRHHRPAKAAHHFKVATKLLKKARRLDSRAGDAFHAAGVL
jgi:hypothetical protein